LLINNLEAHVGPAAASVAASGRLVSFETIQAELAKRSTVSSFVGSAHGPHAGGSASNTARLLSTSEPLAQLGEALNSATSAAEKDLLLVGAKPVVVRLALLNKPTPAFALNDFVRKRAAYIGLSLGPEVQRHVDVLRAARSFTLDQSIVDSLLSGRASSLGPVQLSQVIAKAVTGFAAPGLHQVIPSTASMLVAPPPLSTLKSICELGEALFGLINVSGFSRVLEQLEILQRAVHYGRPVDAMAAIQLQARLPRPRSWWLEPELPVLLPLVLHPVLEQSSGLPTQGLRLLTRSSRLVAST